MGIDFAKMAADMKEKQGKVNTSSDMKSRGRRIEKIKWKPAKSITAIASKILEFPFNPFDLSDAEYSSKNRFVITMNVDEYIVAARQLYHTDEAYKKEIDDAFKALRSDVSAMLTEADGALVIPTDEKTPVTESEIAVYNSFAALFVYQDIFRTIKSANGKGGQLVVDMTKYEETDYGLEPVTSTMFSAIGQIEMVIAANNNKTARERVNTDPVFMAKTEEDKNTYVKSMSWGNMIVSNANYKAILPVFYFTWSQESKTAFEDKKFNFTDRSGFLDSLAFIQDADLIKAISQKIGSPEDKYPNYLEVLIDFPLSELQDKDAAILDSYKGKSITVSPTYSVSKTYKALPAFMKTMWDKEFLDTEAEKSTSGADGVCSYLSDYFRKNCTIFIPWSDDRIQTRYTSQRKSADFNQKFSTDQLEVLAGAFQIVGLDIKQIASSSNIENAIAVANGKFMLPEGAMTEISAAANLASELEVVETI